jgi:hypothetical protein
VRTAVPSEIDRDSRAFGSCLRVDEMRGGQIFDGDA